MVAVLSLLTILVACSSEQPTEEDVESINSADIVSTCASGTDTIEQYAAKCDLAMGGVTVPDFNCDDGGTEPPRQGTVYGNGSPTVSCGAPNVLNSECDPGSKFHMLHRNVANDGIYIAAHCRKKGQAAGLFGDIAVIQYNNKTGSTGFYQVGPGPNLSGDVKAPSKGGAYPWDSPSNTAAINCVSCHDNGPFIRSPYLAQLGEVWPQSHTKDANWLPGTLASDIATWNNGLMPYKFVGLDFQSWEVYSLSNPANPTCTGCHRMGISKRLGTYNGGGTAQFFGLEATKPHPTGKIPTWS